MTFQEEEQSEVAPRSKFADAQQEVERTRMARQQEKGRCPICREREAKKKVVSPSGRVYRRCDKCGKGIPRIPQMQGAGFESHQPDHFHQTRIDIGGRKSQPLSDAVMLELCYECYLKDFAEAYPGEPLPIIANVEEMLGL